jgi:hypothetical protein
MPAERPIQIQPTRQTFAGCALESAYVKRIRYDAKFGRIRRPQVMPDDKKAHKASAATLAHIDELLDEALKQTFPASDPVAINIERPSDERR